MDLKSKNAYIDKLDDIVDELNNTYHRTIKMKTVGVKSCNYVECNVNSNDEYPKIQFRDHIRISKNKYIFAKGYTPNCSEHIYVIKKLKTQYHEYILLMILLARNYWNIL